MPPIIEYAMADRWHTHVHDILPEHKSINRKKKNLFRVVVPNERFFSHAHTQTHTNTDPNALLFFYEIVLLSLGVYIFLQHQRQNYPAEYFHHASPSHSPHQMNGTIKIENCA